MAFPFPCVLHHDCCNSLTTVTKLVQLPAQGYKHQKEHQLPVIHSSDFILASLFHISRRTGISVRGVSKYIAYCVRACCETSNKELLIIKAQTLSVASLNKVFTPSISYVPQLHPHQQPALCRPLAIQNSCSVGYLSRRHCVRGVAGDLSWGRQELRGTVTWNCFAMTDSLWDEPFPLSFLSPTESLGVCGWDGNYVMPRNAVLHLLFCWVVRWRDVNVSKCAACVRCLQPQRASAVPMNCPSWRVAVTGQ